VPGGSPRVKRWKDSLLRTMVLRIGHSVFSTLGHCAGPGPRVPLHLQPFHLRTEHVYPVHNRMEPEISNLVGWVTRTNPVLASIAQTRDLWFAKAAKAWGSWRRQVHSMQTFAKSASARAKFVVHLVGGNVLCANERSHSRGHSLDASVCLKILTLNQSLFLAC